MGLMIQELRAQVERIDKECRWAVTVPKADTDGWLWALQEQIDDLKRQRQLHASQMMPNVGMLCGANLAEECPTRN